MNTFLAILWHTRGKDNTVVCVLHALSIIIIIQNKLHVHRCPQVVATSMARFLWVQF